MTAHKVDIGTSESVGKTSIITSNDLITAQRRRKAAPLRSALRALQARKKERKKEVVMVRDDESRDAAGNDMFGLAPRSSRSFIPFPERGIQ